MQGLDTHLTHAQDEVIPAGERDQRMLQPLAKLLRTQIRLRRWLVSRGAW